jgi:hypothetical protein
MLFHSADSRVVLFVTCLLPRFALVPLSLGPGCEPELIGLSR